MVSKVDRLLAGSSRDEISSVDQQISTFSLTKSIILTPDPDLYSAVVQTSEAYSFLLHHWPVLSQVIVENSQDGGLVPSWTDDLVIFGHEFSSLNIMCG